MAPPQLWSEPVWALMFGIAEQVDLDPSSTNYEKVHEFLKSFAKLVPCPECSRDFGKMVSDDFESKDPMVKPYTPPDHPKFLKNPNSIEEKTRFFDWLVWKRALVAKKVGRNPRDKTFSKPSYDVKWFSLAWNALFIFAFNYPIKADDADIQTAGKTFFTFVGEHFPIPTEDRSSWKQLMELHENWFQSRESIAQLVYHLRKQCQKVPELKLLELKTYEKQWQQSLHNFLIDLQARQKQIEQFRKQKEDQEKREEMQKLKEEKEKEEGDFKLKERLDKDQLERQTKYEQKIKSIREVEEEKRIKKQAEMNNNLIQSLTNNNKPDKKEIKEVKEIKQKEEVKQKEELKVETKEIKEINQKEEIKEINELIKSSIKDSGELIKSEKVNQPTSPQSVSPFSTASSISPASSPLSLSSLSETTEETKPLLTPLKTLAYIIGLVLIVVLFAFLFYWGLSSAKTTVSEKFKPYEETKESTD